MRGTRRISDERVDVEEQGLGAHDLGDVELDLPEELEEVSLEVPSLDPTD